MNPNRKFLITNADDLGLTPDINAAIEEFHQAGWITNATMMVDAPHVEGALEIMKRNPRLNVGLHLDLSPVLGLYELPYDQMRANARTPELLAKVAADVARQIARLESFGVKFTHLDSHRHFHALPEVFSAVIDVAAARGLKTIRLMKDWILPRTPSVYWDEAFLRDAKALLDGRGIRYAEHFVHGGHPYSEADFLPGWNELMVHVGRTGDYLREYILFGSPELPRRIQASGVELKSFRDLAHESERVPC